MLRSLRSTAALTAVVALLAVSCGSAQAQVKPFKITGAGVGPAGLPLPGQDPRPHWIVGVATHLGLHYGEGTVRTDSAVPDLANGKITGEFGSGSPFEFVGANGDKLVCHYGRTDFGASKPGSFELTILDIQADGQSGGPGALDRRVRSSVEQVHREVRGGDGQLGDVCQVGPVRPGVRRPRSLRLARRGAAEVRQALDPDLLNTLSAVSVLWAIEAPRILIPFGCITQLPRSHATGRNGT